MSLKIGGSFSDTSLFSYGFFEVLLMGSLMLLIPAPLPDRHLAVSSYFKLIYLVNLVNMTWCLLNSYHDSLLLESFACVQSSNIFTYHFDIYWNISEMNPKDFLLI